MSPLQGWWKRRWRPRARVVEYHFLPFDAANAVLFSGRPVGKAVCGAWIGGKAPPGQQGPWTRAPGPAARENLCPECLKRLEEAP